MTDVGLREEYGDGDADGKELIEGAGKGAREGANEGARDAMATRVRLQSLQREAVDKIRPAKNVF